MTDILALALSAVATAYPKMQVGLFSVFLSLGGMLFASLAFLSTRIHDMMKSDAWRARAVELERARPGNDHTSTLQRRTRAIRGAVWMCFGTAVMQITLGFVTTTWAAALCVGAAIGTVLVVWAVADKTFRVYQAWLERDSRDIGAAARLKRVG